MEVIVSLSDYKIFTSRSWAILNPDVIQEKMKVREENSR